MEEFSTIVKGRYKIENLLGQGTFAKVFKAKDIKNNKYYAIKQLSKNRIDESDYLPNALKLEVEIMGKLEHENSVKLIEYFETDNKYNIVMELCDSDLDIALEKHFSKHRKGYSELELWFIMNQFNKIFFKMTQNNVIHRDLKLKNIMIKYNKDDKILGFTLKLSDFGFSKFLCDEDITYTELGTPATQAPEIKIEKKYNNKCDLWSVGVIIYKLLFNKLPFKSKRKKELIKELSEWKEVELPENNNNPITEICFDLIKRLLQKKPEERIEFKDYFKHKYFSEEHKKYLDENIKKLKIKEDNLDEKNKKVKIKEENKEKEQKIINKKDDDKKKIIKDEINQKIEKKIIIDFDKNYKKLNIIKDYNGYKLYRGKNLSNNKYVYIKEISRPLIDNNNENKKLFDKEIELLTILDGNNFPKFIGLSKNNTHYNIIIEYFSGKLLDDYIKSRNYNLNKSFLDSIYAKLKAIFLEIKEKDIIIDIDAPKLNILKCVAFTFYQNENNFEIKFYDYGLNSIFLKNMGQNITYNNNLNFRIEDIINFKIDENENKINNTNLDKKEPKIKDGEIEYLLDIIKNKINTIYDYFNNKFKDKDNFIYDEVYSCYYREIIIFLYFCHLECETILKFLKINSDINTSNIDKTNQEIHLLKLHLYLNENNNDKSKYTYINFIEQSNNNDYFYNKENPLFGYYQKIFNDLKTKINDLFIKFKENIPIDLINENDKYIDIDELNKNNDNNDFILINKSDIYKQKIDLSNKIIVKSLKEGNLDKLFLKIFENIIVSYSSGIKDNIINELNISQYLIEYIIFLRAIFGNVHNSFELEKMFENKDSDDIILITTFIGGKIRSMVEKHIFDYKIKGNNLKVNNIESKEDNIDTYYKMINFYEKIRILIHKIK